MDPNLYPYGRYQNVESSELKLRECVDWLLPDKTRTQGKKDKVAVGKEHHDKIEEVFQTIQELPPEHSFEKMVYNTLKAEVLRQQTDLGKLEETDLEKLTLMHLVAIAGTVDLMEVLVKRWVSPPEIDEEELETKIQDKMLYDNLDINAKNFEGRTPLHLAALLGKSKIVEFLVTSELTTKKLRGDVEDVIGQTAYEIAVELEWHEIVRELLVHPDVTRYLEEKRSERAVYGGGINAILVGAVLIASITFAGWLEPPLGYQPYFQYPRNATMASAPPDDFQQYASVSEHLPVKVFWISNSLSFYCAIASILAGAAALVPRPYLHELAEVRRLRGAVNLTIFALSWAVLFVVMAFTSAGFAALPPVLEYEVYMIVTLVIGFFLCLKCFMGARMSDPLVLQTFSSLIDPSVYLAFLSMYFEILFDRSPGIQYQSYESRLKDRKERYHPMKEEKQAKRHYFAAVKKYRKIKQDLASVKIVGGLGNEPS